jgi:hypothetical protein
MRFQSLSFKWVSVVFLLLLGYVIIVSSVDAQGSTECDRQALSPEDCPPSSSEEEGSNNGGSGNIEDQIPSVIPFP